MVKKYISAILILLSFSVDGFLGWNYGEVTTYYFINCASIRTWFLDIVIITGLVALLFLGSYVTYKIRDCILTFINKKRCHLNSKPTYTSQ